MKTGPRFKQLDIKIKESELEATDLLLLGTEVSVAFAGFSGIIATFQLRSGTKLTRGDVVGITIIVQNSLVSTLFCVWPLVFLISGVDEKLIWAFFSGAAGIWGGTTIYLVNKTVAVRVRNSTTRRVFRSLQLLAGAIGVCLILNASNLVFHREPGPLLAAIVFGLGLVGLMFSRLLLRPLWRSIREQES